MRFIPPGTGAPETTLAEDQLEYAPLTVAHYQDSSLKTSVLLARLTFNKQEREAIAAGEDLYIGQMTFGQPFTPLQICVGPGWFALPPETP